MIYILLQICNESPGKKSRWLGTGVGGSLTFQYISLYLWNFVVFVSALQQNMFKNGFFTTAMDKFEIRNVKTKKKKGRNVKTYLMKL